MPVPAGAGDVPSVTLVVLDAPKEFCKVVASMGFVLMDRVTLDELQVVMTTVNGPTGHSEREARALLLKRFPGLTIDAGAFNYESMSGSAQGAAAP